MSIAGACLSEHPISHASRSFADSASGGIGASSTSSPFVFRDEVASGGVIASGGVTLVCLYLVDATGGAIGGGVVSPTATYFHDADGGGIVSGFGSPSVISERTAAGGVLVSGGHYFGSIYTLTGNGGAELAGDSLANSVRDEVASGGVIIPSNRYPNGFPLRTTIVVPAGNVTENLDRFRLGLVVDLPDEVDEVLITDADDNPLTFDVIDIQGQRVWLYVKTPLLSESDNVFYLYSGVS